MPAAGFDRGLWRRVWDALRAWVGRALGRSSRRALPPAGLEAPPAGGDGAGSPARSPEGALPPPPLALAPPSLGPHTRATWSVQWRPPLLGVPCPRCEARLDVPVWKVLCYEDVSCRACGLTLRRAG